MSNLLSISVPRALGLLVFALLGVSLARAEPHEHHRTDHWVVDSHYHHDHRYPRVGYSVHVLPTGAIVVTYRGGPFYYHAGVWYRPSGRGFVVITPPIGIVVPVLPPTYTTIYAAGVRYYYANNIYYQQMSGGYAVANQPTTYVERPPVPEAQSPQSVPPQASAAPAPEPGTWYYCDSAKAYYPYVSACKEGWRAVPAAPPSNH
jgi:hypothetical protein